MQLITASHLDDVETSSFRIRDRVDAVRVEGGAQLVDDDGKATATYGDTCYIVRTDDGPVLVSAYVFDGLYEQADDDDTATITDETQSDGGADYDTQDAYRGDPAALTTTTEQTTGGDNPNADSPNPTADPTGQPEPGTPLADRNNDPTA